MPLSVNNGIDREGHCLSVAIESYLYSIRVFARSGTFNAFITGFGLLGPGG